MNKLYMKKLKTVEELVKASENKKAVYNPKSFGLLKKPMPAAVVLRFQAILVYNIIKNGLYIYNKKETKKWQLTKTNN